MWPFLDHLVESELSKREEIDLVRQAKSGDREAFDQLMEAYAPRAYRLAFAIVGNESDAEDVVQEAFVTIYRKLRNLREESSFNSWLSRIVATRAHDLLRQRRREKKSFESQVTQTRLGQGPSSVPAPESEGTSLDLRQAIDRLPELHRLVILLRYGEEASIEEIAQTLKRPEGTIRRMLSEAYRMLRLYLEGDEGP